MTIQVTHALEFKGTFYKVGEQEVSETIAEQISIEFPHRIEGKKIQHGITTGLHGKEIEE